jgi:chlorophyllide a reductase subunit Y
MCPAFGSLRVGLRMRRTATVLCGSACCVYGLTFTSHFYGARRSVGYVPFDSETLVTGKLFEDIREAVHELADPEVRRDRRHQPLRADRLRRAAAAAAEEINGVRIIGIDVPGFGVPTHAEAKDVLAGAMLAYARGEAEQGPVQAPRQGGRSDKPTVTLLGEMFPADPVGIGMLLEPLGSPPGPVVPTREWRELYAALDCAAVAAIHPFYTASIREFEAAGRPVVGSAPVGHDGTAAGSRPSARLQRARRQDRGGQERLPAGHRGCAGRAPINGTHHPLRLRGLRAAGGPPADRERRPCALRRHRLPRTTAGPSRPRVARGPRRARCSSAPRWSRTRPPWSGSSRTSAIGTTPVVQQAKQRASRRCTSPT